MGKGYTSHAAKYKAGFEREMSKRVKAASAYLSSQVKADISQPGTLRYQPTSKKTGKRLKGYKTVYNFTHSRPGNPPYKQTGQLRASIGREVIGLVGRVGSNIRDPNYPLYLELGTKRMAARSYLRRALKVHRSTIVQLITRPLPAGGVPKVVSNQFRPGHMGSGTLKKPPKPKRVGE